jgi:diamine N-acetyltransferase
LSGHDGGVSIPDVGLAPVTAGNWKSCAALAVRPDQQRFVNPVTYYLCLCHYGDVWHPLAVTRGEATVGFVMWGVDDDLSRWIGGLVVDAPYQRTGVGRGILRALMDRFAAEPDCPNVALSYAPENSVARDLYRSLGFRETGETEGTELVARWRPR